MVSAALEAGYEIGKNKDHKERKMVQMYTKTQHKTKTHITCFVMGPVQVLLPFMLVASEFTKIL